MGEIVDLLHANTFCNVFVAGGAASGSFDVRVQTSDGTTSGSFVDGTSGLAGAQLPTAFQSGGVYTANSGLWTSGNYSITSPVNNAPLFCSGGVSFAAFQRQHRYARLLVMSGPFIGNVIAGFITNKHTTGSGGGYTTSPTSGSVNV